MQPTPSRRAFVRSTSAVGAALGLGDLSMLSDLSAVEARKSPELVRFDAGIEPLVQLLETTPRAELLPAFAARIKDGTSYREVLTALHLAGIRNIPPRPDVGWKFHAVLVLNPVHLATQKAPAEERWLPIFWALDFFKSQQMFDERESDWSMSAVDEAAVPDAAQARAAFVRAMDAWDDEAADAATASLLRSATQQEVFDLFAFYGMRDFRNIGHKPIHMASSWRTLQYVGWRHAEPMMRSLTYAFLNHAEEPNPSTSELEADAPWRHNLALVDTIEAPWSDGLPDPQVTARLLATLREGSWAEASGQVAELLEGGAAPQTIIDGLFAGAAELLLRQPSIYSVHAMTSTNALMYALRNASEVRTRRLLLLQNAAFLVQFREYLKELGPLGDDRFDQLRPSLADETGERVLDEILEQLGEEPAEAARRLLAYLGREGEPAQEFMHAARAQVRAKCRNGHDYKFSVAVFDDYKYISETWRDRYLATSVYYLPGSTAADSRTLKRTRAAFEG